MLQLACAQIGVLLFSITFAYGLAAKDASSLSNDQFSLNALHNQVDETSNSDDFDFFADGEPDMGEDASFPSRPYANVIEKSSTPICAHASRSMHNRYQTRKSSEDAPS